MSTTTTKQISETPLPNAVNKPHDPKLMQAQVDRKMSLYAVVQAFAAGKYPSNDQISRTLDYAVSHEPINVSKLSKEGRMLVQDFRNIIKTSKAMVEQNNADELFQNFLYHTRAIDYSKAGLDGVNTPGTKDDASQAATHLRTLGKLIFTNSEARKLLKDAGILGRDVAADAAAKVSDLARPHEDDLATVDQPAPSNQWVGPDGETRGHNESVPDTGLGEKMEQAKQAKEQAKEAKEKAKQQAGEAGDHVTNTDPDQLQQELPSQQDVDETKESTKNQLLNKIPEKHKDLAKEHLQKVKDYGADKFPEERRDQFIYRLKKVVVECQRHRDYQEAIEFFIDQFENHKAAANDLANQSGDKGLDIRKDEQWRRPAFELRTLLERFANEQSMQPIFDAVEQIYTDAKNDEELRAWFRRLDSYVRRCLQEPGYIMKEAADREGRDLLDSGKVFWDPKEGKYAGHKDALFDSVETFFRAYADDELNVQLGKDVKKLTKDLLMDADGNLKYKPHLWNDIREVILPTLATEIGAIPIPRIEYTDHAIDVVIENLILESQNILPNIIEMEARNYFKLSPYAAIRDQNKHSFWISFSQVQADIKDVAFYIKRKTGFPKITDSGVADVVISGKGISGKIHVESTGRKDHAFNVVEVKVKIDKLKFAVRESKYSFLISTLKPLLTSLIKKAVAKGIEEGIRNGLVQVDAQIADISERIADAKKEDGVGQIDALKQAYSDKKAEAEEAKEKVEEKTPSGQFQVTARRDSKLVNWSSPNSLVEKEGAAMDTIGESKGWKSPAFDIVGKSSPSRISEKATANAPNHH